MPAVTELMVAELLYLEKQGATLPIEMLINSSGTTRQDGEIVGHGRVVRGWVRELGAGGRRATHGRRRAPGAHGTH